MLNNRTLIDKLLIEVQSFPDNRPRYKLKSILKKVNHEK